MSSVSQGRSYATLSRTTSAPKQNLFFYNVGFLLSKFWWPKKVVEFGRIFMCIWTIVSQKWFSCEGVTSTCHFSVLILCGIYLIWNDCCCSGYLLETFRYYTPFCVLSYPLVWQQLDKSPNCVLKWICLGMHEQDLAYLPGRCYSRLYSRTFWSCCETYTFIVYYLLLNIFFSTKWYCIVWFVSPQISCWACQASSVLHHGEECVHRNQMSQSVTIRWHCSSGITSRLHSWGTWFTLYQFLFIDDYVMVLLLLKSCVPSCDHLSCCLCE